MSPLPLLLALAAVEAQPPALLQEVRVDQRLGAQVPLDASFTAADGRSVRLGELLGDKPVVLSLAYYECPMLCSMVLNGATRAVNAMSLDLGSDFTMLTVSIDPTDTPAVAASKRRSYLDTLLDEPEPSGRDPWPFLVGQEPAIRAVADAVGFRYVHDATSGQYAHAAAIMVLTPQGKVSRYLYGLDYSARDLRLALVEAGGGGIGNLADEILLQCFRYDPMLGRYSMAIMGTVRVLGAATFLLLAGYVAVSFWRDRRRPRVAGGVTP